MKILMGHGYWNLTLYISPNHMFRLCYLDIIRPAELGENITISSLVILVEWLKGKDEHLEACV